MKVLYISTIVGDLNSGGGVVSGANHNAIKQCKKISSLKTIKIGSPVSEKSVVYSRIITLFYSIFNYATGLYPKALKEILNSKDLSECDYVWVDGSLLGKLNKLIKDKYPEKKIITFFHNVEFDFWSDLGKKRGRAYKLIVNSCCNNEKLAVCNSDYIFTLTNSDSERLKNLYGRGTDLVLPVTFKSKNSVMQAQAEKTSDMLFVGSDFPPNVEALEFLFKKVMPFTDRKLIVVGKGMEKYRNTFQRDNIEVIGFVDDVSEYYEKCNIVLTPIFSGAGMKVKVADALNSGKIVIGTSFSFIGYDALGETDKFLFIAETASDYLNTFELKHPSYSCEAKKFFEKQLSSACIEEKMNGFFKAH
jgi:hypothetical protein